MLLKLCITKLNVRRYKSRETITRKLQYKNPKKLIVAEETQQVDNYAVHSELPPRQLDRLKGPTSGNNRSAFSPTLNHFDTVSAPHSLTTTLAGINSVYNDRSETSGSCWWHVNDNAVSITILILLSYSNNNDYT